MHMHGTLRPLRTLLATTLLLGGLATAGCNRDPNDMAIKSLEPGHGGLGGEQAVSIHGRFHPEIGYTVYFGTKKSEQVLVRDTETLVAVAPRVERPGAVDITILADNGPAFRVVQGYLYEAGGGNVIENLGSGPQQRQQPGSGSNLAY